MNEQPKPEDEILNKILFEIKRYENNQREFIECFFEFFDEIKNDDESE